MRFGRSADEICCLKSEDFVMRIAYELQRLCVKSCNQSLYI